MDFKAQMEADLDSVFFHTEEFAELCIYTPKATGVPIADVAVIIDFGTSLSQTEYGAAEVDTASFKVSQIADPRIYDTFIYDGITYSVLSRIKTVHGMHTVSLDTDQRQNPKA